MTLGRVILILNSHFGSQVQLGKLTSNFQSVTDDVKRRFAVNGESIIDEMTMFGSPNAEARFLSRSLPLLPSAPIAIGSSGMSRNGLSTPAKGSRGGLSQQLRRNSAMGSPSLPPPAPRLHPSSSASQSELNFQAQGLVGNYRSGLGDSGPNSQSNLGFDELKRVNSTSDFGASTMNKVVTVLCCSNVLWLSSLCCSIVLVWTVEVSWANSILLSPRAPWCFHCGRAICQNYCMILKLRSFSSAASFSMQVNEKLAAITEHVQGYSGLQSQLDAVTCQYRQVQEQLATATAAITKLQQDIGRRPREVGGTEATPGDRLSIFRPDNVVAVAAATIACVTAGTLLGMAISRGR